MKKLLKEAKGKNLFLWVGMSYIKTNKKNLIEFNKRTKRSWELVIDEVVGTNVFISTKYKLMSKFKRWQFMQEPIKQHKMDTEPKITPEKVSLWITIGEGLVKFIKSFKSLFKKKGGTKQTTN